LKVAHNAPEAVKQEEYHLRTATPKVNVWSCIILLAITIAVMAATAEFVSNLLPPRNQQ
jgi:Ca2+:H+ antiporter